MLLEVRVEGQGEHRYRQSNKIALSWGGLELHVLFIAGEN